MSKPNTATIVRLHTTTKRDLSQEYKAGLIFENQLIRHINVK